MAKICSASKDRMLQMQRVLNGGIKGNRFSITLNLPSGVSGDARTLSLMATATNVPAMTTNPIEVQYFGKTMSISGDESQAGDWTVTAMANNSGQKADNIRIMSTWQKLSACSSNIDEYMSDAKVDLLNPKNLTPLLSWRIENIWVGDGTEISLDMASSEILTTDIQFKFFDVVPLF